MKVLFKGALFLAFAMVAVSCGKKESASSDNVGEEASEKKELQNEIDPFGEEFSNANLMMLGGVDDGNNSDSVICKTAYPIMDKRKVVLRDLLEGKQRSKDPIKKYEFGPSSLSVNEKVALYISRIKDLDPMRYELYKKWLATFDSEMKADKAQYLHDRPEGSLELPGDDCDVKPLVLQQEPYKEVKRYTVDHRIYKHLDDNNKAVMKLHEIVTRETRAFKGMKPVDAREFVANLVADRFKKLTRRAYADYILSLKFSALIEHNGTLYRLADFEQFPDGKLKTGTILSKDGISNGSFPGHKFLLDKGNSLTVRFRSDGKLVSAHAREWIKGFSPGLRLFGVDLVCGKEVWNWVEDIEFYPNGRPKKVKPASAGGINLTNCSWMQSFQGDNPEDHIFHEIAEFYDNGVLKLGKTPSPTYRDIYHFQERVQGKLVEFCYDYHARYKSNLIKTAVLRQPTKLKTKSGSKKFKAGTYLNFDENGLVTKSTGGVDEAKFCNRDY